LKIYENIVIGAGASGLMFVANLKNKKDTLIIDSNSKIGAKILVSGGGRCNFTNKNISTSDYLADSQFIKDTLKQYSNKWLLKWFTSRGLEYSIKNDREYFCKNSAKDLLNILKKEIKGAKLELNSKVLSVEKSGDIFKIFCEKKEFFAKNLIVTSGGLSFPILGASSVGYDIAKSFGHTIITPNPALVGFTLQPQDSFFKTLSGVSVEAVIKVDNKEFSGSLLFAHKGLSGPVILNASLFWQKGHLEIDFLPNFNFNAIKSSNKLISNLLPIPRRVAKAFLEYLDIEDKSANRVKKEEWQKLETLKSYKFAPAGTFGYSKAEVTKGGINTEEIDNNTFMSKKVDNLYFLGEVLDVTGRLGGFNFQWAFASATKCASNFYFNIN